MPNRRLLDDVASLVNDSFGGRENFSCITGSCCTDRDTPTSDIDIVVVLPNNCPLGAAKRARMAFTRGYVEVHRMWGRTPDLRWPGEVLYQRDLESALSGGTFELDSPGPGLGLCHPDRPYRYWVSMVATGHPVSKQAAFEAEAERSAWVIARHVMVNGNTEAALNDWHLGAGHRVAKHMHAVSNDPRALSVWRTGLRPPFAEPMLDSWLHQWRHVARQAQTG